MWFRKPILERWTFSFFLLLSRIFVLDLIKNNTHHEIPARRFIKNQRSSKIQKVSDSVTKAQWNPTKSVASQSPWPGDREAWDAPHWYISQPNPGELRSRHWFNIGHWKHLDFPWDFSHEFPRWLRRFLPASTLPHQSIFMVNSSEFHQGFLWIPSFIQNSLWMSQFPMNVPFESTVRSVGPHAPPSPDPRMSRCCAAYGTWVTRRRSRSWASDGARWLVGIDFVIDWLVVWLPSILFSQKYWEFHLNNWLSYFSEGWSNHQPG